MGTVATGVGFALKETSTGMVARTLNFPLAQGGLQSADLWAATCASAKDLVENPYVGLSLGFAAMCGAVASLALAYTGSF